jgi:hypothetical protein
MSWATLGARLQAVIDKTPPQWQHLHPTLYPRYGEYIQLRDIAVFLKIEYTRLTRVRRGERLNDTIQSRLSWFFHAQDRGRLKKERLPDGKWHIVYRPPQSQTHADETGSGAAAPSRPLPRIIFTAEGVRLKL